VPKPSKADRIQTFQKAESLAFRLFFANFTIENFINLKHMRTFKLIPALLVVLVLSLTSCGPSLDVIGVWSDKTKVGTKAYKKIFVFALTSDIAVRNNIETEMAAVINQRGLQAVKGGDVMPPSFYSEGKITRDELKSIIVKNGCDGIVSFVVKDQKEETRYVPGTTSYAPAGYGYYDPYYGYYSHYSTAVYSPGYYTTDRIYFLESNFYDVETESMVWSVQSETVNPTSIKGFSKQYVHVLVRNLQKNGIIK
jgi:hypothetical protein